MINRRFTNISAQSLAKLIGLKDAKNRKVSEDALFDTTSVYYLSSIRLFIKLNFKCDTNTGIAADLVPKELANEARIHTKTLYTALKKLSSGSDPLISYSIDGRTDLITVQILNYKDMFKRRGEGGYGYIQFDDELSDRYCAIRSINDMRVGIRALLECNEQNGYEATISMQQIRSGMPGYVKPCYIKKSLQALRGIFKEATSLTKKAIHISLNDYVRVPEKKLRLLGEGESTIRKMVYDLNEKISEINADFLLSPDNPENRLSDMVADRLHQLTHMKMDWKAAAMNGIKSIPLLSYSNQEYSDAANLILQFGTDAVLYAIQKYHELNSLRGNIRKNKSSKMAAIRKIAEAAFSKKQNFNLSMDPLVI